MSSALQLTSSCRYQWSDERAHTKDRALVFLCRHARSNSVAPHLNTNGLVPRIDRSRDGSRITQQTFVVDDLLDNSSTRNREVECLR